LAYSFLEYVNMSLGRKTIATALMLALVQPAFAAAPFSGSSQIHLKAARDSADDHRRWRHHDRISGDDILTGIGIIAGVLILADAAGRTADREVRRAERHIEERRAEARHDDETGTQDDDRGNMASAMTLCEDAAVRSAGGDARVEAINSATRNGEDGWRIEGDVRGKQLESFSCVTVADRVDSIRVGEKSV
jgi:hypothetical protein